MTQFKMLLRREWMQHRTGWLLLLAAPTLLLLLLSGLDGGLQINIDGSDVQLGPLRQAPGLMQTALLCAAVSVVTLGLALLTVGFQLPSLARRDRQDRSIKFWGSLPVGHAKAVSATLVAHLLLLPWAAMLAGALGGVLVAGVTVLASHGLAAWLQLPWGLLLVAGAALLARLSLGLLLAMAWLSPLLLLTMAASAWLKRWGVPVLVAAMLAGTLLLDKRLAQPVVQPALDLLTSEALQAMLRVQSLGAVRLGDGDGLLAFLRALPGALLHETVTTLGHAATPAMALALATAALGFWLLVLRRQRGG